jgi:hypothetical protein
VLNIVERRLKHSRKAFETWSKDVLNMVERRVKHVTLRQNMDEREEGKELNLKWNRTSPQVILRPKYYPYGSHERKEDGQSSHRHDPKYTRRPAERRLGQSYPRITDNNVLFSSWPYCSNLNTVRMRRTIVGDFVWEYSVCILSGTCIIIMGFGDIHDQCVWRNRVIYRVPFSLFFLPFL